MKKSIIPVKLTNTSFKIDGVLNEQIWGTSQWHSEFIQYSPYENSRPSEKTEFTMFYDDSFLIIGIKNHHSEAHPVRSIISRRDELDGDWIEIMFDSFYDSRSAFVFSVNSSGVKGDRTISDNGLVEDPTWNPVWFAKTVTSNSGWVAEIKIPFSQLRFSNSEVQTWGLQIMRRLFQKEELSTWQPVARDAGGWVSEFGELREIKPPKNNNKIELQPFSVLSLNTFKKEPTNPFRDDYEFDKNLGLDGKVGLTNDLTLDLTINPDFGQVEADPGAIALDGFQLFFTEQRPFFNENKNIFDYRFSKPSIGSPFSSDNLFYSRRIGRAPQGIVSPDEGEHYEAPQNTSILGAIKLSGKTENGFSIGVLESITAEEYATISNGDFSRTELIEPRTNYFVSRIQQDFNQKNSFIGGILTATHRNKTIYSALLHNSAITAGIDFMHQWNQRSWFISANGVFSNIKGNKESILNTQLSVPHLFQRVGASHVNVDSSRTSLTGTGGDIKIGKIGSGKVRFETGITWRSPSLELNDIGFMREADIVQNYFTVSYHILEPFSIFREASFNYKHWLNWDFEGNLNYFDWDVEGIASFSDNSGVVLGFFHQPWIYSKSLMRGGPRLYLPSQYGFWWAYNTDQRKKVVLNFNGWTKDGGRGSYYLLENSLGLSFRPSSKFNMSVSPRYSATLHRIQYSASEQYQNQNRYITSYLDQKTLGIPLRFNYSFSRNISLQYYGEPFISTARYSDFGYVNVALSKKESERILFYSDYQLRFSENNLIEIDENLDGNTDYNFQNPDFSFAQFRSNIVLRYEYRAGSELFLIWSQGIQDTSSPNSSLFKGLEEQLLNKTLENIFLVKATFKFLR